MTHLCHLLKGGGGVGSRGRSVGAVVVAKGGGQGVGGARVWCGLQWCGVEAAGYCRASKEWEVIAGEFQSS